VNPILGRLAGGIIVLVMAFGTVAGAAPAEDGAFHKGQMTINRSTCWVANPASGTEEITFSDVTDEVGLTDEVTEDRWGHGVAWGDVNNDEYLDFLLGTFADYDPLNQLGYTTDQFKPDQLAIGGRNGFTVDTNFPETYGWTSGLAFADLDNDGYKDLVLSRNQEDGYDQGSPGETVVLRNDVASSGGFEIIPGAIPPNDRNRVGGRSVAVLDYNADGLLDLFITQDRFAGGESSLLRNTGGFRFVDATEAAGLPTDIEGFGVAAKDLTGDGHGDLYVVGSNRLFVANGDGTFREVDAQAAGLVRPEPQESRPTVDFDTGVSVGDVNRDGRPDVAVAHHYDSAASLGRELPPVSLYLNRGLDETGNPVFEDVTEQSGLPEVASRAADVNINDYDNDGWPDLISGVAVSRTRPAVFRHLGMRESIPQYAVPEGVGEVKETAEPGDQSHYGLPVAPADYDRDGRLDVFYDFFFSNEDGQLLLRNESESGHWLSVGLAQGGIGTQVAVYHAGGLGDSSELIGQREIAATDGYSAGVPDYAHFGLGDNKRVDLRVMLPPSSRLYAEDNVIKLRNVPADRHLQLPHGCHGGKRRNTNANKGEIDVTNLQLSDKQPLIGGHEYTASVSVTNSTARETEIAARIEVPDGWVSETVTRTLGAFASATVDVPITPGMAPSFGTLTARVTSRKPEGLTIVGWPYLYGVTSVAPQNMVALALDAGTSESPVLPGFKRLTPEDAWDATRGYGWLENTPQADNREPEPLRNPSTSVGPQDIDALQQDFVLDRRQATLRIAIPPGHHTAYLLTGDAHRPTANVTVSSRGQQLAETGGTYAAGVFKWTKIELDGVSSGRTIGLQFSAEEDNRPRVMSRWWYLNGLVLMSG
jgi:hypothetical protein